jgi:hypothetical protein
MTSSASTRAATVLSQSAASYRNYSLILFFFVDLFQETLDAIGCVSPRI